MHVKPSEIEDVVVKKKGRRKTLNGEYINYVDGYTELRWVNDQDVASMGDLRREYSLDGNVHDYKEIDRKLEKVVTI